MRPVVILGGGGQARVVMDAIEAMGERTILGIVYSGSIPPDFDYPTLGRDDDLPALVNRHGTFDLFIAVGDGQIRRQISQKISKYLGDVSYCIVVHPRANKASRVELGAGSFLAIGATVGVGANIGEHSLINTNASVDHGCTVGAYASIAPNAAIGGDVCIGEAALIGIGATVLPGLNIGAGSKVASGALVTRDVPDNSVAIGVPAQIKGSLSYH